MSQKLRFLWWLPTLILSIFLNIFLLIHKPTGVKVIGIIDGDTIVLEGKSRVRLRYIDAPEKGLCGHDEASKALEELVVGKSVRIEETIPDQYGRGMALVYVGKTLVNQEMITSGWVRYHHDTTRKTDDIKEASDKAKENKFGVYGLCQSDTPEDPKCIIKGNIDDNSDRRNYYLPTCAQYKFTIVEKDMGENWFCTEKEAAAAGFTKAKTCK